MPATSAPAGARPQQAAEDADDGRFAGAVGAEKAHDLAAADAKAHMIDGDEVAEALDQILDDDLRAGLAVAVAASVIAASPRPRAARRTRLRWSGATTAMSSNGTFCRLQGVRAAAECASAASSTTACTPPPTRMTLLTPVMRRRSPRAPRARRGDDDGDDGAGHALFERGRRVAIKHAAVMQAAPGGCSAPPRRDRRSR